VKAPQDGVQDDGPDGLSRREAPHRDEPRRLQSRAGSVEVEKHLGKKVKTAISSSVEVPRALNAGELLLLTKPGAKVSRELAELVKLFVEPSSNGTGKMPESGTGRSFFRGR
jgi:hypothetical protein